MAEADRSNQFMDLLSLWARPSPVATESPRVFVVHGAFYLKILYSSTDR
jgi:hypothetical protein